MTIGGRRELAVESFRLRQTGRDARLETELEVRAGEAVQAALVRAGELPGIEEGLSEREWGWVPRTSWEVATTLAVDADLAGREALFLECDGLETVGRARLGRKVLGRFENGLRPHRFDLSGTRAGEHALSFEFEPLFGVLAARNRTFALPGWGVGVDKDDTAAWVRTAPVHMGWDFAPKAVPVGVTGPVRLVGFDRARIDGVRIAQDVTRARATLKVTVELERVSPGAVQVEGLVAIDGEVCATAQVRTRGARAVLEFVVRRPRLWWPNTYGEQPLYTLSLVLRSEGTLLDACQRRLGLRKVELLRKPDRDGEGFAFAVNGRRIDVRGANWVPPEPVPGIGDPEGRTADLLGKLASAHATMVRVWGGGPVATDHFYDHCDALGLLVWQDFSFACSTYPTFDRDWMVEVETEARHHVRRVRHHASLALWCGNNEVENGLAGPEWTDERMAWKDYRTLFDRLLADVVRVEDGATSYWPGSPHSPVGDRADFNAEGSGDAHLWTVWHGGADFASFRESRHRLVSEFGFQSLPSPATLGRRVAPDQRNLTSPHAEHLQRAGGGLAKLLDYTTREHRLPADAIDWCWLTQILQAEGIALGVEHWRRQRPRSSGSLVWQWNEPWAAPTWSAVDRDGRAKALYHALARAWSPLAVSLDVDGDRGRVDIWAVNDRAEPLEVGVRARIVDPAGEPLAEAVEFDGRVGAGRSVRLGRVELAAEAARLSRGPAEALLLVERVDRTSPPLLAKLAPWKEIALQDPELECRVIERTELTTVLELTASRLAPWTFVPLDVGAAPGADFVHLAPRRPQRLEVPDHRSTVTPRARSLFDLR